MKKSGTVSITSFQGLKRLPKPSMRVNLASLTFPSEYFLPVQTVGDVYGTTQMPIYWTFCQRCKACLPKQASHLLQTKNVETLNYSLVQACEVGFAPVGKKSIVSRQPILCLHVALPQELPFDRMSPGFKELQQIIRKFRILF